MGVAVRKLSSIWNTAGLDDYWSERLAFEGVVQERALKGDWLESTNEIQRKTGNSRSEPKGFCQQRSGKRAN